ASMVISLTAMSVRAADPAELLQTLPGFKIEAILAADKQTNGSWICMAKDNKGRLLIGAQRNQPVTRVTIAGGKVAKQEKLKLPFSETMGILWANDSLYVNGSDGKVFALWRCWDTDGDDQFDKFQMLREWKGGSGEHGAHAIVMGPDKKLYIVC